MSRILSAGVGRCQALQWLLLETTHKHTYPPAHKRAHTQREGLFLGLWGLGTGDWVLVIHPMALIENWQHGLKCL